MKLQRRCSSPPQRAAREKEKKKDRVSSGTLASGFSRVLIKNFRRWEGAAGFPACPVK